MKASVYTQYGSPEVLRITEVEKPLPNDNEVLIKIHATTVNRTDCGFLRGKPVFVRLFTGLFRPRRTILGNEFAGVIEAVGKGVTLFKESERVFGYSGDDGFGAHAEYMTFPEGGMLASIPENMTYEEAAPSTEGGHYALNNIRKANVRSGQRVLINGATGGIGSVAVQLVKYYGAEVTAVCDTERMDLVKSLGADSIIDYTHEDFTQSDERYDFIFDAVGKSSFGACKKLLIPGGIYCPTELGFLCQNPFLALMSSLFGGLPGQHGKHVIFPIPRSSTEDAVFFKELIEAGKYKAVIDRYYPLEDIAEAYRYVEQGQKTGNIVIRVN